MNNQSAQSGIRIIRNAVFGFSTWILPIGLSFIATPVIVRALGNEDYGIYALVLGFIAYSFNFNVGRAITKYVAEYRLNGESERIREIVSATAFVNLLVGGLGLLLIAGSAGFLVRDVLQIAPVFHAKSVNGLYIAGLTIFFLMLNQVFTSVLQGVQRFDLYAKLLNVNNFLVIGGNLGFAANGFGLNALLLWNLGVTFVSAVAAAVIARSVLPELSFRPRFSRQSLRTVIEYSRWVILYQIFANALLLFERSWITAKLGAESLTYYVVPMTLALYIQTFMSSLMLVLFPLASEMMGEPEKILRLYLKSTKVVAGLTVFLVITLLVLSEPFLASWMGPDFAGNSSTILKIHVVTFGMLALAVVAWQITEGLGFPNYNFFVFLACFTVSVSGMVGLVGTYGNVGIAIGRFCGFSVLFASIFLMEKRFFGSVQIRFWLRLTAIVGVAGTGAGVTEYFLSSYLAGWPGIILAAGAGGVVYSLMMLLLGFVTEDERAILRRVTGG